MLHSLSEFPSNAAFFAGLLSWCTAQLIKMGIAYGRTRKVDWRYMVSTGGMPSAHSATVSGLATAVGLLEGFGTPVFALSVAFALITMFDAATVRYAAGQQARIINQMVAEFSEKREFKVAHLKELLGHTRFEVLMGMLTGIVFSTVFIHLWVRCHG